MINISVRASWRPAHDCGPYENGMNARGVEVAVAVNSFE